ncbi:MAG TPA: FG-GAP-like repeat-containing protein [Planctomycetota bacterium]|nr:FG-GAP-like repeat-containing protein [Planctomycetota bacterium]
MRERLTLAFLACLATPVGAVQQPILEFHGTYTFGELGYAVDGGSDLDGDGHDDLLVSASGDGPVLYAGAVYVYSGADGHVIHAFHGDAPNDLFGGSTAFAGDLDGDGVADVIVAARGFGSPESYARAFSGADGHELFTVYTQTTPGTAPTFEAVDGIGDVNADGHGDVVLAMDRNNLIGEPTDLQVRSGVDGALLHTIAGVGFAGSPVRGAGDVDLDGVGDFIYGDQYQAITVVSGGSTTNYFVGAVRAYSGLDGHLIHEWIGDGRNDRFGISVDGLGDVDGDGFGDVVGGATQWLGYDLPGYVRAFSGRDGSLLHEWKGSGHGGDLGSSIARGGDVDGDGREDLLIGDYGSHFTTDKDGSVRVVSGHDSSLLFEFFGHSGPFSGTSEFCTLGLTGLNVASAGDVDADGRDDVIIAAHNDSTIETFAGSAWVFGGRDFAWHETPSPSIVAADAPELSAFGALETGNGVTLLLTDAEPFQPCWIVAGLSQVLTPFLGGVLVPSPDVLAGPLLLNSAGGVLLSSAVPPALPAGTTICLQVWCASSTSSSGFVGSNAIEATAD